MKFYRAESGTLYSTYDTPSARARVYPVAVRVRRSDYPLFRDNRVPLDARARSSIARYIVAFNIVVVGFAVGEPIGGKLELFAAATAEPSDPVSGAPQLRKFPDWFN